MCQCLQKTSETEHERLLVFIQIRMTRLQFAMKYLKEPAEVLKTVLCLSQDFFWKSYTVPALRSNLIMVP